MTMLPTATSSMQCMGIVHHDISLHSCCSVRTIPFNQFSEKLFPIAEKTAGASNRIILHVIRSGFSSLCRTIDTDAKKVSAVRHQATSHTFPFFDKGVQLPA